MLSPLGFTTPLGSAPVVANAAPPAAPAQPTAPAEPTDGVAPPSEPAPPPPPTAAEILASARASALETNKTWLKGWQSNNPWDAAFPPPKAPKKPALALWAAPKPLTNRQKGQVSKLVKAGFSPKYARQIVERGDTMWIGIMSRNPVARKRK